MAFFQSLEIQTTSNLIAFATSAFSAHSLLSTVAVVQGVVNGEKIPLPLEETISYAEEAHQG